MEISAYNIGLRGHDIGDDFRSMCENAVKNKITFVQFAMAKTMLDIDFDVVGFDEVLARTINRKLNECNLAVSVLGCYINPIDTNVECLERMLRRFEAFIQYAAVFDAGVVGTETGIPVSTERDLYQETYRECIRNLARLVEMAEQFNVNIGIEPVWCGTVCSPQIMQRVIDDLQSEKVKVIFDLSNLLSADMIPLQKKIMDESFELFGDKIAAVHLKDFELVEGHKRFAPVGQGLMDIHHLFDLLSKLNHKPDIILDELPLVLYHDAIGRLKSMLGTSL